MGMNIIYLFVPKEKAEPHLLNSNYIQ